MIEPHGGVLVSAYLSDEEIKVIGESKDLKELILDQVEQSDLELMANGAFSPLSGFMGEQDYQAVLTGDRLASGLVWTIPIVLSINQAKAGDFQLGDSIALFSTERKFLGVLYLEEKFQRYREREALSVFGTTDQNHPGVAYLYSKGEVLLGGKVKAVHHDTADYYPEYYLSPQETREEFVKKGWRTIVAFQTRNPIHRAHEYLQKVALEMVDGLLIHPLVGHTKSDDIPAAVRIKCYETLIKEYYPKNRVMLSFFPAAMRYAGPKEAVFHGIVRKNYGCTHFIVGRDHAGVGNYYGSYAAQNIFDRFTQEEIGINIFKFENTFYCKKCGNMASEKTCPHQGEQRVFLSGTKVREMLNAGFSLPPEFTREEVSNILSKHYKEQLRIVN